ncbi:Gfo/Idh/MocA family protein [Pseudonocardia pini]|uniref:Gfo/Idh/MocA family protein n=1 Tax=Pseudonocardia pini TaxID=2758030 RepID=UPI0015F02E92|nr:Gfo/Idh/MocA family oxidoreductase [Pseudonocardia pini]
MRALPEPRIPDPRTAPVLRWGVLGTGWIAERFVDTVQRNTSQRFTAVGSRSQDAADRFAAGHGIARAHGSYAALVEDPQVDVVYVASPHTSHRDHALLALEAGKHVLVEKPLALDAAQAGEIAAAAGARGLFAAEALWTFFLPRYDVVRQLLGSGALGTVRSVQAEYGEAFAPDHRIFRTDLAGGPLLDLGTYPLSFVTWVLGAPETVLATAQPHPSGVHGQLAALLTDRAGNQGLVHTTLYGFTPTGATVVGTEGVLTLPGPFPQPGPVVLDTRAGRLTWTEPAVGHEGLYFEAAEVARRIADGHTDTPLRTLPDSVVTLAAADRIRARSGIVFPHEHPVPTS